jgi:hypothetical protein
MEKSTEIRWFLPESDFKFLERLFAREFINLKFNKTANYERKDFYLNFKNNAIGIKIRDAKTDSLGELSSKLELKTKIGEDTVFTLYNNIEGRINRWVKHSFKLEKNEKSVSAILKSLQISTNETDWIMIEKERLLVKFDLKTKEPKHESIRLPEACGIELTKIKIKDRYFYSLGFEAFSESEKEEENLLEALEYFHSRFKPNGLKTENSLSYPEFINQILIL